MKIPYFQIQEKLQSILQNDDRTRASAVELELPKEEIFENRPGILIWLANAPRELITVGGNKPREVSLEYLIECSVYDGLSIAEGCNKRDDLIADVEEILQQDATRLSISDEVAPILFVEVTNTEFETGRDQEGFLMSGTLTVIITLRG